MSGIGVDIIWGVTAECTIVVAGACNCKVEVEIRDAQAEGGAGSSLGTGALTDTKK